MPNLSKSIQWAINTCNAPKVGYSMQYRNQKTVNGITYYDCSSFIWYALKNGEFEGLGSYPFTTSSMTSTLINIGFTEIPITGEWKQGDILWHGSGYNGKAYGHTEIVYSGGVGRGITMGAHSSSYKLADQVSIKTTETEASYYQKLFRYGEGGGSTISIYVISAMCGNFWQESTINPSVWESLTESSFTSLNHGYGLGQWTNTGGDTHGRLYRLYDYLTTGGYSIDDGNAQIDYLIKENVWYSTAEASEYSNLTEFLNSSDTDLTALTHAFNRGWEGIHDSSWDARVTYANNCYNYILEHYNDEGITNWITGNRYLSDTEKLNNAVMVYRKLSNYAPPYKPTTRGNKMPIWMMLRKW